MSANDFNNPKGNSDTASILAELRRHYLSDDLPQTQKQEVKKAIDFYEKKFAAENGASASSAPVFYTADGRPVIPVYFPVDANGNPIAGFPGFNGASAEPEEEFEELPDGTKMKIIYQDAAFKKEEQENKEKKKQQKKPDADYFSSMKVVYESSEAFEEPEETEEKKEPEEPPKAEEVKAAEEPKAEETQSSLFEEKSSSLADLFSETNEESKEKAKKKKELTVKAVFIAF